MTATSSVASVATAGTKVGRVRWSIVVMIFLVTIINYADRATMSVAKPEMSKEFGINAAQMGWILSAFGWSYVICQIPGGWGLGSPQAGLFLQFRHDPEVDPVRRRFTLLVDCLTALEERLQEEEWPYQRIHGFGWTDQYLLAHDPAGHLIEIRQSQPL